MQSTPGPYPKHLQEESKMSTHPPLSKTHTGGCLVSFLNNLPCSKTVRLPVASWPPSFRYSWFGLSAPALPVQPAPGPGGRPGDSRGQAGSSAQPRLRVPSPPLWAGDGPGHSTGHSGHCQRLTGSGSTSFMNTSYSFQLPGEGV